MAGKWSNWFTGLLGRSKVSTPDRGQEYIQPEKGKSEKDDSRLILSEGVKLDAVQISAPEDREAPSPPEASSRAMASGEWKPGDTVLKDYRVEGDLGKGGMGEVYLVRSVSTGERFAVKRARVQSEAARRNFVNELQTWRDLPAHPNLAACRFFRSVEDEIVILSEYLEGGSLDRWIHNGRGPLYQGESDVVLARILDIAIQSAWGLHALHEWGLTHQDVKPGNVLLTADGGQVNVCDFGIARLHMAAEISSSGELGTRHADYGGMTPAFCSPEQKERRLLSRKTDVWSWGLSVLQMFTGTVWREWGTQAEQVLQSTLRKIGKDSRIPAMPPEVAEILRKCFHQDPAMRWGSLFEAAEALRKVLAKRMDESYLRPLPAFRRRTERIDPIPEPRTKEGGTWLDPRRLLAEAFEAAGLDAAEAVAKLPPRAGSRQAQAIADMSAYEEVLTILTRLIGSDVKALEPELAEIYQHKAFVHEFLDDVPGALALHERAIEIRERLVKVDGRWELANDLAGTYQNMAAALWSLGEHKEALALTDQAIEIRERLVKAGRLELRGDLATLQVMKAAILLGLDQRMEALPALPLLRKAVSVLQEEAARTGRADLNAVLQWAKETFRELL